MKAEAQSVFEDSRDVILTAGAPVSVPLAWEELSVDIRSDHFTVDKVVVRLNRLKQDPWRDYVSVKQKLTRKMRASLGMSS